MVRKYLVVEGVVTLLNNKILDLKAPILLHTKDLVYSRMENTVGT